MWVCNVAHAIHAEEGAHARMTTQVDRKGILSTTAVIDLTNCDLEPISTPSAVQSHGVLLVAKEPGLQIVYTSENSAEFLGFSPAELFKLTLPEVLGVEAMQAVEAYLLTEQGFKTAVLSFPLPCAGGAPFDIQVHRINALVYVELEGAAGELDWKSLSSRLQSMITALRRATTLKGLCESAALQIRSLTGYDRTMIYRFDSDGHGEVFAEDAAPGQQPYLGLHYPATDIPVQARALYLKQRQRVIADALSVTAHVLLSPSLATETPLDMTYCGLRAVSPIHLEYLTNMGVRGTMVMSLIHEERLWGLIVCHHRGPRNPPQHLRALTGLLGEILSMLISALEQSEQCEARLRQQEILNKLRLVVSGEDSVALTLASQADALLKLVHADGACIRFGGQVISIGAAPVEAPALMTAFQESVASGAGSSDEVGAVFPEFAFLAPLASGGLMIQFLNRPEDGILWVRGEFIRTVTWGGDPSKSVITSPETGRMSPRKSFEAWQQIQRGRSLPWTSTEVEAARALQRLLTTAMLHRAETELAQLSQYDSLTELPNRRSLLTQLAEWQTSDSVAPACIMFLDLDNFKTMNDSMGHEVGDRLLNQVAQRLRSLVDAEHLVARLGGDEFVVFCRDTTLAQAGEIAATILSGLAPPFLLEGTAIRTMASIGIAAVAKSELGDHTEPLRAADSAMYVAKQNGGNQAIVYQSPLHDKVIRQNMLEQALFNALERDELSLAYQPQVELVTGAVVGFEALLRWTHPGPGMIPPSEFIPLAEKLGLIDSIGYWVMEQSLLVVRRWREMFHANYTVSVNVSVQQIIKSDFTLVVGKLLESTGVPPAVLCLEVTEGILMHDLAVLQITRLRAMGIRISIDDFGTGYSSLGYLQRVPVDQVKVDRSLLDGLDNDNRVSALLGAIVNLVHTLDLLVVAEGVETHQQWKVLRKLRCDLAQGYYLCHPAAAGSVEQWLREEERVKSLKPISV